MNIFFRIFRNIKINHMGYTLYVQPTAGNAGRYKNLD